MGIWSSAWSRQSYSGLETIQAGGEARRHDLIPKGLSDLSAAVTLRTGARRQLCLLFTYRSRYSRPSRIAGVSEDRQQTVNVVSVQAIST